MFKIKSFRRRILLALMGVGLVPAVLLLLIGTALARYGVDAAGSAGPWSSLAESGQVLMESLDEAQMADSAVLEAARVHQEALSQSLRLSRIFELVAQRLLTLLPLVALFLALVIGGLSYWVARQLSGGFSRPIHDLVGWTELIGRGEPLPEPGPADTRGVKEFATLRSALREMATELEEGRREAIQAAKLRTWTEMARKVAHELKNPLGPMHMAATTVSRMEAPGARDAGRVLLEEIQRLDEMARTFSQFGRMPEGPPSPVDLGELLKGLVRQHDASGPTLDLRISPDLPRITGHYDALLRTFRNLLLNGIQAAGAQGLVQVRAWCRDDLVGVEIHDSGPGIPPDKMEQIWEPEYTTRSGGTGLGLPMVRQTVAFHRGRVESRNHPDGGAVFSVELPTGSQPIPPGA
jgi:signal transduction histidine kinase